MNSAAYLRVSSDKQTALRQRESLKDLPIDRWYEDSEGSNPRDRADRRLASSDKAFLSAASIILVAERGAIL